MGYGLGVLGSIPMITSSKHEGSIGEYRRLPFKK